MIKNEHQYRVSQDLADKFERCIASLEQNEKKKYNDPEEWEFIQESYQSQLNTLRQEIAEYETITNHDPKELVNLTIADIEELSDILIKARIALKISEKELADLSELTESEIKSYEENDYQNAKFVDAMAVINALGIRINKCECVAELSDFYQERLAEIREPSFLLP
ncbi:DNA-binding protein [Limnofasciculus baicalensis]|uniref:DNA-binding protein n=1 Tax=Limnofasciculus baicalensis BBK-W-15 TaxID=2699891 RepID=A0AAE3KQS3_9CYAN|nr:DNA-binding protein [Limnofasciculus baicalensis]MCP2730963.1 DNA-binding protein [Limnofasciculus baicalensis BBK-W-15]